MSNINLKNESGVSLYLTLIVMVTVLGIALGLSAILFSQIRVIRGMGNSVVAFYAADTGIEKVLMDRDDPSSLRELDDYSETLDNNATYKINVYPSDNPDCNASNYCIKSVGAYNRTERAIEIKY